jgi:hypothetical protein
LQLLRREGSTKLDKKQKISWGVSFGSLALVAGMVSYLGLSNGDKANNQMSAQNNNFNRQQPNGFSSNNGQDQNQNVGGDDSFGTDPNQNFGGNQSSSDPNQEFGGDQSSQFNQGDDSTNSNSDDNSQFFGNNDGQN